ncbi:MAG: hypothetical protein ACO1OX_01700 [Novosphingobium sp.]
MHAQMQPVGEPIMRSWNIIAIAVALAVSPVAQAQKPEPGTRESCMNRFQEAIASPLASAKPFLVLAIDGSITYDCEVVAFYVTNMPNRDAPDRAPIYMAKRWYEHLVRPSGITYIDGAACEQIKQAMWTLSHFELPSIDVPGLAPRRQSMVITVDGAYYSFWTNRLQNGDGRPDTAEVSFDASNNAALIELNKKMLGPIKPCWTDTEPAPR